jgi:hypothetical protein
MNASGDVGPWSDERVVTIPAARAHAPRLMKEWTVDDGRHEPSRAVRLRLIPSEWMIERLARREVVRARAAPVSEQPPPPVYDTPQGDMCWYPHYDCGECPAARVCVCVHSLWRRPYVCVAGCRCARVRVCVGEDCVYYFQPATKRSTWDPIKDAIDSNKDFVVLVPEHRVWLEVFDHKFQR